MGRMVGQKGRGLGSSAAGGGACEHATRGNREKEGGREGDVARYILKRLVLLIIIIVFVSVAVFFLVHLLPGNPATTILGPNATAQNVATINRELGLNKPLIQQYFIWIGHVLQGNLGQSFTTHQSTTTIIAQSFPIDLELIIFSQVLAFAIAFPMAMTRRAGPTGSSTRRRTARRSPCSHCRPSSSRRCWC